MSKQIGEKGENEVSEYLKNNGYVVLQQNYSSRYGEIDIIASKDDIIAFVEVKTRKKSSLDGGVWAITSSKQSKIIKTALLFLQDKKIILQPRFDVAVVEYMQEADSFFIDYFEGAFDGVY